VYPVSSFTWLLLYQDLPDKQVAKTLVDFLQWALTDGQKFAADLGYAPLPKTVVDLELKALAQVKTR
jgi:phosphate transport system substrate-binding protein